MNFGLRRNFPKPAYETGICHNQSVRFQFQCGKQSLLEWFHLGIPGNHVTGQVELFSLAVNVSNPLRQVIQILETIFASPQRKRGLACVHSIGPVGQGVFHTG